MSPKSVLSCCVALVALAGAALPARAESDAQLYAKAKTEKTLVFYAGGPTAPWEAAATQFKQLYPGIDVTITGGFSNVLDLKIDDQLKARKLEVDMAFFQTVQDYVRWKKEGVLLKFKPEGFDKIDDHWKDKDGAYVGVSINAHPYAYNPQLVKPADVPKSALDFLKPEFRGKVVAAYPQDDDATLYDFDSIVRKYGWSYMEKYMANQPNFIQGHLGVARSISAGDNLVTLDTIASISLDEKSAGKPQELAFSKVDPLPVWPLTTAIFKDAPHPNAAKLFLNFYLSKDFQKTLHTWSSRSDVPPPAGLKPVLSYHVVNSYREFLTNQKALVALRAKYAKLVGPITNKGGVR